MAHGRHRCSHGGRAYKNTLQASLCVMLGAGKFWEICLQPQLITERPKHIAGVIEGLHCVL